MKSQTHSARPIGTLEAERRARGLRQSDLAKAAGVATSLISFAESGYVPTPKVELGSPRRCKSPNPGYGPQEAPCTK